MSELICPECKKGVKDGNGFLCLGTNYYESIWQCLNCKEKFATEGLKPKVIEGQTRLD